MLETGNDASYAFIWLNISKSNNSLDTDGNKNGAFKTPLFVKKNDFLLFRKAIFFALKTT